MDHPFKYLKIDKVPKPSLVNLLEQTVYGTPGKGILYQHCKVKEKVQHVKNAHYVSIVKNNTIVGSACLCKKESRLGDESIDAFYVRFFTFKSVYRTKGAGSKRLGNKNSLIKREVKQLLFEGGLPSLKKKACFYGFLELQNHRSIELCKSFGFKPVREFSTSVFSRFFPRKNNLVERCNSSDKQKVKSLLIDLYKKYNLVSFENLFLDDNYFVVKDKTGEIVAGVQANLEHWKINEMPGVEGKFILKVFPYLPILKGLFNPDYKFLSFESIYLKEGHEKDLAILFESVLALKKMKSAMMWFDANCSLQSSIDLIKMGILNKFAKNKTGLVYTNCVNYTEEEMVLMSKNPVYISAFDLT